MKSRRVMVGKYELAETLGHGTFGKVKKALDTSTNTPVAIKVLDKAKIQSHHMSSQIKKEITIMKMIKHRSVIELKEVLASESKIFIVLELVTGGELFDHIMRNGRIKDEAQARKYFRWLIEGVEYCHSNGVCHRDLKPENILLDESGGLKISDFGLAATDARGRVLHTTCGTPNYVAPEVLMDKGYDGEAADVWSTGVILYVLLAGFLPFDEPSLPELFRKIVKGDVAYPKWISDSAISLVAHILNPDPAARYKIADIMQHPWYLGEALPPVPVASLLTPVEPTSPSSDSTGAGVALRADSSPPGLKRLSTVDSEKRVLSPPLSPPTIEHKPSLLHVDIGLPFTTPSPHFGNISTPLAIPVSPASLQLDSIPPADSKGSTVLVLRSRSSPVGAQPDASAQELAQPDASAQELAQSDASAARKNSQELAAPLAINAFDLINMAGFAAVNRMFQRDELKTLKPFTQFSCNLPALEILDIVKALFEQRGAFPVVNKKDFTVRAELRKGPLVVSVRLYQIASGVHMVGCRREQGDILAYQTFYLDFKRDFQKEAGPGPMEPPPVYSPPLSPRHRDSPVAPIRGDDLSGSPRSPPRSPVNLPASVDAVRARRKSNTLSAPLPTLAELEKKNSDKDPKEKNTPKKSKWGFFGKS